MSCYVALDGPDGCGKSTQAAALVHWLEAQGADALHVREPGSTPVGEALRELLLAPATGELQPISEVLLFSAARAELLQRVVRPALAAGRVVVAERCYLSTAVYQLLAAERPAPGVLDQRWFEDLTRRVHGDCLPDAIFVLDVPAAVSAQRRSRRDGGDDRIEARGDDYHGRVRDGYLRAAAREPRAHVLDASRSFDELHQQLRERVSLLATESGA
ncbi:MAG: dTMP kinase [Planctomycetes bacterium]|nr:dTMP kinase [Planctomycetota bacterium]